MHESEGRTAPWLVAAWPGMGGVAQIAAAHLAARAGLQPLEQLDAVGGSGPGAIQVDRGIVQALRAPRSVLHGPPAGAGGRSLLVLLNDRQPANDLHRLAGAILDRAEAHRVERVVTFAAMGTPIHPGATPRVFAAATAPGLLQEALRAGAVRLDGGEISGMNGYLLGVAAQRGVAALGLLGEMPFYAAGVANPRAAAAVLQVFGRLADRPIDVADLEAQAQHIEQALLERLPAEAARALAAPHESGQAPADRPRVAPEVLARIEELFGAAAQDRGKALELKAELDKHGLFRDFEDRFLDLFRQGS